MIYQAHNSLILNKIPLYKTRLGAAYLGDALELLESLPDSSINLVITSPPFALQREKEYGNKDQESYIDWLFQFAKIVFNKLKEDGSFVLDLGGAYRKGIPSRSLYNFRIPIKFCDELGFHLSQDFYWHNPSKLPSPIEWVNKRKIRTKDSVNTVWWFSKTAWPKSNVKSVLAPYSDRMKKLLENPEAFYRPMKRPSGHDIGTGFGKDNGGAIPSNLLTIANSESNGAYFRACKTVDVSMHPARFPYKLPEFFIKFLTEPGDTVLDIFSGSNTSGEAAEKLGRKWLAFEQRIDYLSASAFRFMPKELDQIEIKRIYTKLLNQTLIDITEFENQTSLFISEKIEKYKTRKYKETAV